MVKVIMGLKGSGKTGKILEIAKQAVESEQGDTVFIEPTSKLIHDVPQKIRWVDASKYDFGGYRFLKGYITGLYCANYDITHIFIDNLLKIADKEYDDETDVFVQWCDVFGRDEDIKFTITISADVTKASEQMEKFF